MNRFRIEGYWKDDKEPFEDYIVVDVDGLENEDEVEIFFFGLSEENIIEAIKAGEEWEEDFVITGYELVEAPNFEDWTATELFEYLQSNYVLPEEEEFEDWKHDREEMLYMATYYFEEGEKL